MASNAGGDNNATDERQYTLEIDDESGTPGRIKSLRDSMNNHNGIQSDSPESGIELESRSTHLPISHLNSETSETLSDGDTTPHYVPPNEMFSFDLTDPEDLVNMMENVDLTEEDTDVLLDEAYKVNETLKRILKKQAEGGNPVTAKEMEAIKNARVMVPGTSSRNGSRIGSANKQSPAAARESNFAAKNPLPPISDPRIPPSNYGARDSSAAIYSAKVRRPAPPASAAMPTRNALSSQAPGRRGGGLTRPGLMV